MDADGSNGHSVPGTHQFALSPDWSPDGQTILYTAAVDGVWSLYAIPAVGGEPELILNEARDGRWSPDGKSIVFTGTGFGLFRVYPANSQIEVINPNKKASQPVEQP